MLLPIKKQQLERNSFADNSAKFSSRYFGDHQPVVAFFIVFEIVLVEPEIPHNAGAAGRLAVATGSRLHLIKPLGFSLDEKAVRRAGLDYWREVNLVVWDDWAKFNSQTWKGNRWMLTTKGSASIWDAEFSPGDLLIFGAETRGLSTEIRSSVAEEACLRIPMSEGPIRSLNLSTSIAIVLYEACRQNPAPFA